MFKNAMTWVRKQIAEISEVHTEITWEEALDDAVLKIHNIDDIESKKGKAQLTKILDALKGAQCAHRFFSENNKKERDAVEAEENPDAEESKVRPAGDEEDGAALPSQPEHMKRIMYLLPWELPDNFAPLRNDQITQVRKEVFALAADEESLLASKEQMAYEFDFDMDCYVVVAQILLKLDKNLQKMRHQCVPDLITEDEFWLNYFYRIECIKATMGIPNYLGKPIDKAIIEARLAASKKALDESLKSKAPAQAQEEAKADIEQKGGEEIEL
jgi:hypothetical protein